MNKLLKTTLMTCGCMLMAACAQKIALDSFQPPPKKLAYGSAVYVTTPADGQYGARTYANSGRTTEQALFTSLSSVTNKIEVGPAGESLEAALNNARQKQASYLFQPLILNWEDHATEWSGIPDRITIKVVVYDVESGKDIASMLARSSSKWATFGGDHPQNLLPKVMNEFTKQIF